MDEPPRPQRYMVAAPPGAAPAANCPVEVAIAPIAGKWKTVILWHLAAPAAPLRFADLRRLIPGVSARMLSRQLRELEADGLIWRDVWPVSPPRVEYGLTARGLSLRPVLNAMCAWGKANGWSGPGF
jgi:DNA-binding HxlR family transcriptional regulator